MRRLSGSFMTAIALGLALVPLAGIADQPTRKARQSAMEPATSANRIDGAVMSAADHKLLETLQMRRSREMLSDPLRLNRLMLQNVKESGLRYALKKATLKAEALAAQLVKVTAEQRSLQREIENERVGGMLLREKLMRVK